MIVYRELFSLERDLGISVKTLYAVSNNLSKYYRKAKLPKKSGGYRNLSIPDEVLKSIQISLISYSYLRTRFLESSTPMMLLLKQRFSRATPGKLR